ncbi:MAG: Gfo/Idh/MocA family oxidoreductase [Gemmatimonadetes bacterium]|nr:Gfo/Idh/MocA family oxidoreductase [Gemmatimonadota bacterium]
MRSAQFQIADYIVVVGYFLLLVAIGVYFRRFMRGASDYFTGDNQLPWWLAGVSYYMTYFSAFAFVAYGEVAYRYGWVAVTLGWVAVPACLIAARWSAQRWRRARISTPVEFLETRYSPFFRQLFAWSGFPLRIIDDGLKLYSLGVFVSVAGGLDIITAIVVSAVVVLAYTFLGGLWAVTVTDFVQGVMLYLALFILLPLALIRAGGLDGLFANTEPGYLSLSHAPYSWVYLLGFFVLVAMNHNAGWALVQRFYSVPDEREARKVGYLAAALNILGPPLFYLPVMLAKPMLGELENTRNAYAVTTLELLPAGLMGIMMTAMLSATMSTLSAEYNVLASVATRDIYARLFRPKATEAELLRVGKLFTMVIGVAVLGVGVLVALNPDAPLFGIMVTVFGVAVAPMMLPLLGGLFSRRLTRKGAMVGFVVGLLVGFTTLGIQRLYLPGRPGYTADWISFEFGAYAIFINVGVTVLAMMLWTRFERRDAAEDARIADFFARMDVPVEAPAASGRSSPSPFYITGVGVLGVAGILLVASFFVESGIGRWIDVGAALVLALCGALLYRTRRRAGLALTLLLGIATTTGTGAAQVRVGIIGLDTSHSTAFTRLLNDSTAAPDLAGFRVVAAYPYGSRTIESSARRIPGYTAEVEKLGVQIVGSIAELLPRVDAVLLETNDGRLHLEQALEVMRAGKPLFIDKPIAASLEDAIAIFDAARFYGVPVFSSSSLRYAAGAQRARRGGIGRVLGADAFSPATLEPTHPDLYWYGVHGVEMLYTAMGTGVETVARTHSDSTDVVVGRWSDGRIGTFRGIRGGRSEYGGTAFGSSAYVQLGPYEGYRPLLVEIVRFFRTRQPPVTAEETLEIFAFMSAADESKRLGGAPVRVADVLARARTGARQRWSAPRR